MKKLNIFVAIQNFNWESINLISPLIKMGHNIIHFDWKNQFGYDQYSVDWQDSKKQEMNELMLKKLEEAHTKYPIDLFFSYLSDPVTYPWVIEEIKSWGILTLNYSCNDMPIQGGFERGVLGISPCFDLNWTANKAAINLYKGNNAKVIWTPYGINQDFYKVNKDIGYPKTAFDFSFIGQCYGYRLALLDQLFHCGLSYAVLGKVSYKRLIRTVLESRVNVSFAGIGNADFNDTKMKQLRLRDFEVAALGGFYITERASYIEGIYEEDKEIVLYSSIEEFIDKVVFYSRYSNNKIRKEIARAGQKRCLENYKWDDHYLKIFSEMNLL